LKHLSAPLGASIEVTKLCNLNCRYCFQGSVRTGSDLSNDEIYAVLEELADMKVFTVFFGGGEPLLRPDFFEIAERAMALGLEVGTSTNGTLLTDELALRLAGTGLCRGLQVSLDGSCREVHDVLRGEGSFDAALAGIRSLSRHGIHPSIAVTVTTENIRDVSNVVRFAVREGLRHVHVMCLLPAGNAREVFEELEPTTSDWAELEQELAQLSQEVSNQLSIDWGNRCYVPPWPEFSAADYSEVDRDFTGCPAGKTKAVIDCFGDVYGCDVLKTNDLCAGSIRSNSFREIWHESPVFRRWRSRTPESIGGKCADCKWSFACVGGCPAMSVFYADDFFAPDTSCPHDPPRGRYELAWSKPWVH